MSVTLSLMFALLFSLILLWEILIDHRDVTRWRRAHPTPTPVTRAQKRRSPLTRYVTIQTYFRVTEAPFGLPLPLVYGARVSLPAKYASLLSAWERAHYTDHFHSLIQLPGAFIER